MSGQYDVLLNKNRIVTDPVYLITTSYQVMGLPVIILYM
jgi:hypothetical protein